MGLFSQDVNPLESATEATNQNNNDAKDEQKNIKRGILEKFHIPINETKNTPLIITNCRGHFLIGIHNTEGRMALTMASDKPEETIDVSRLPSGKYIVTIMNEEGKVYKHEVLIRN